MSAAVSNERGRTQRPWGWYESVDRGPTHQVKRIHVHPGQKLSLQKHQHRQEHWVVVAGSGEVTVGHSRFALAVGQTCHIPTEAVHRLANTGAAPLEIVEVQIGAYLGEDDIVRLEDDYGRR